MLSGPFFLRNLFRQRPDAVLTVEYGAHSLWASLAGRLLGVSATMLPSRSTMSKCTVSPGVAPIFSRCRAFAAIASGSLLSSCVQAMSPTVGSPAPDAATAERAPSARRTPSVLPKPSIMPGRISCEASRVISLRR